MMPKSSSIEHIQRINMTVKVLQEKESVAQTLSTLVSEFGISKRQAYRYLREAQNSGKPLQIPEAKVVFTVKLPVNLVDRIRIYSRSTGQSLSELVTEALMTFLK